MKTAKYRDVFLANYKVTPITRNNNEENNLPKTDVRLTRRSTDYKTFYDNCLVSVNGYYHLIDTDGTSGIMVLDAMKTLVKSKQNQIGIFNFKELGQIKTYPFIDRDMITNNDGTIKFKISDNIDLTNKTVFVCIGGYFRTLDLLSFFQVGDNLFKLDFNKMSFADMYYESKKYLDLSSLPLDFSLTNDQLVSFEQLVSDENLRAYMKLSQSFIVVLDATNININKQHVKKTGMPGMYISYKEPVYPLVVGFGRHSEYWYQKEDGQFAINVIDNVVENRIYDTILKQSLTNISDQRRPDYPGQLCDAYLLELSK